MHRARRAGRARGARIRRMREWVATREFYMYRGTEFKMLHYSRLYLGYISEDNKDTIERHHTRLD